MSFGAPVAPVPTQLIGSCTTGTTDRLAPNDHCVPQAGNDGISSLLWSPVANHLLSTNWDGGVRCWEVQESQGQIRALPKAQGEVKNT
jgi:mRNA export factor